jgi:thiol:disulfide interchange protein DsbA
MMKRRDFNVAASVVLTAAGWGWTANTGAQPIKAEAGTDYLALDKRVPVEAPAGKIEVVEFFWYSCPHCNQFEPTLEAWSRKLPKDVVLRRVPVAFRDDFVPQQRLYFALEAMDLVDKLHAKVFAAIHVEKLALNRGETIADWVAKQGVDKAKFMEQYSSFSVANKSTRSKQLQDSYRVEGVPALGVAGRYYTDGSLAKSMPRALQVVDFLVNEVRAGR